ncbi:hypothetical protein [Succinivibrio dextrinosolvens]|uniref:hypothetical protein n=1 Tax=Succinivibrio dextrinosolvens TaxID=83771 RepID=UPI00247B197B|nr:hypothetical protein [Succinivibrio dextrinosolvens]
MDNSQIKITSQNQRLTAQIDWILVYDSFVKSNCSLGAFYRNEFPSIIRKIMPDGYIPSISTFSNHIKRIKECGKDAYCRCSRGIANYNNWNKIYDEFISSGSNMNRYYLNNLIGKVDYSRKTFYRQMKRIEKERELMVDLEHKDQNVNIVTLQQHEVDDLTQNSPKKITSTSQVKLVTVKVNLANNTSINFDSPNPEFSVAKIIAALGRM